MGKEILTFGHIEIKKKKTFTTIRFLLFWEIKILTKRFSKISFGEKTYKYLIGYLHNDLKVKPLYIIFLKEALMQKVMMDKLNGCIF